MTPEAKARQTIDERLVVAGWSVQDMKAINLGASLGVAVREFPTDSGPADYVLFVNRNAVGTFFRGAQQVPGVAGTCVPAKIKKTLTKCAAGENGYVCCPRSARG